MRPVDPRILPHLRPAHRSLTGVLAGGTLGGLLTVAQAFAMGTLLVRLVEEPTGDAWQEAAWWLAAIVVGRALAAYVVDTASAAAAAQVSLPLRAGLVEGTLAMDAQALSRRRTGELTLLATRGLAAIEPYLTRYLPTLVLAVVLPAASVVTILWLDWLSGLIVVLTIPLVPVFAILIGLSTQDRADRQWAQLSVLSGHFLDVVRGLPTLVAHRRARAQGASIRRITDRYRRATVETLRIAFASSAALELIATLSVALVAVNVGLRLREGSLDFWTAMVVLLLAPEAYWPLRRVGAEFHAAAEGAAAFEQATATLTRRRSATATSQITTAPAETPSTRDGSIVIEGLTVRYADREQPVLRDLAAYLPAPGLTAVVGPSGSGKTTLLATLLRELPWEAGRMTVGGRDLSDLDPDVWHSQVAWAPQRPWLTAGTLAENLRVAAPDATDEQLRSALRQVALEDMVDGLPQGVDTALGEDGAGLSAGQRARLALARVVLSDRPYVFLDEPTAHLDPVTESVLLTTLRDLATRRCVVVVAHRPAVAEAADRVLTLPAPGLLAAPGSAPTPVPVRAAAPATPVTPDPADDDLAPGRFGTRTGTALGTLSVLSGVALTATASWLITRASEHPPVLTLMVAIVGVRAFGLARPVLRYAERVVSHDAALRLLAERRARVYDGLVPLVPGRLGPRRGDVLASVVDDVDSLVDRRLRVRQPVTTALWVGVVATGFAALLSPRAGVVTALVCLVGGLGGLLARRGVAAAEADFVRCRAAASTRVEEILRSARDLVLWGADGRALAALEADGRALAGASRRSARAVALGRALPLLAGGAGMVAMAAYLTPDALTPDALPAARLALLVMLPVALVDATAMLPDAGALAVRTAAAERRLDALAAAEPLVTDPPRPRVAGLAHPRAESLSVTAGWGELDAFRDLSLALPPGARVGLVGASGTGKSTYAALMLRFLDPRSGSQRLAGIDLRELTLDDVRRLTGLVDDDPHLFGSSLAENVRLARPEATDAEVAAALTAAHLGRWVQGLPAGIHTMIGEGSAHVSGGERARIAVARALLADQPVLVLDEPTAHLDADTARLVAGEILDERRGRSIVWITHGTIGLDDMDTVLELGEVAPRAVEPG